MASTLNFLFDLDGTLVDSSSLRALRDARRWPEVRASLGQVRPFATPTFPPHELPARLRSLGYGVGVVTSSPRWYAEAVLKNFGIVYDTLVAYEDTTEHKPDPAPIQLGISKLQPVDFNFYVGDSTDDVVASHHAGAYSAGVMWGIDDPTNYYRMAPDLLLADPAVLLQGEKIANYEYIADAYATNATPILHQGSVITCESGLVVYSLGRYFPTEDVRHADSSLSQKILDFKQNDVASSVFASSLASFLSWLPVHGGWRPNYIVSVPPKPSQTRDRFASVLSEATSRVPNSPQSYPRGLECIRDYQGYKSMNWQDRATAVAGAFQSPVKWNGNRVLLVDDVATTGHTLRECASVLRASGASEVRALAFGKDQQSIAVKHCSSCGAKMRTRKDKQGVSFWGCSQYSKTGCRYTEPIHG
jgi:HAD superfamily hydrolase (TIGR01549 family)